MFRPEDACVRQAALHHGVGDLGTSRHPIVLGLVKERLQKTLPFLSLSQGHGFKSNQIGRWDDRAKTVLLWPRVRLYRSRAVSQEKPCRTHACFQVGVVALWGACTQSLEQGQTWDLTCLYRVAEGQPNTWALAHVSGTTFTRAAVSIQYLGRWRNSAKVFGNHMIILIDTPH